MREKTVRDVWHKKNIVFCNSARERMCTQAAAQATLLYCDFSAARAGLASVEASAALVAAALPPLPLPPGRTPSGSAGAIIGATIWRAARNASTKGMRARSCSVK